MSDAEKKVQPDEAIRSLRYGVDYINRALAECLRAEVKVSLHCMDDYPATPDQRTTNIYARYAGRLTE